jgi:hypothetical protein
VRASSSDSAVGLGAALGLDRPADGDLGGLTLGDLGLAAEQLAPEDHEQQRGRRRVHDEAGQEGDDLVGGQPGLLDDAVGDPAVDADRAEPARLRAVDDHEAHEQRVDPELDREAERDRGDDRDRPGAHGADGGEHRGDPEHDPGHGRDPAPDRAQGELDQQADGAVVLGDGEQVGDPDQGEEEVGRESADDVVSRQVGEQRPDQEGADEGEHPDVDRQDRCDHKHQDERQNGDQLRRHGPAPACTHRCVPPSFAGPRAPKRPVWADVPARRDQ